MSYDRKCWTETSTDVGHLRLFFAFYGCMHEIWSMSIKGGTFYGFFMFNDFVVWMVCDHDWG